MPANRGPSASRQFSPVLHVPVPQHEIYGHPHDSHAAGGSGSGYISGWCDKRWRPEMSAEECRAFVHAAVSHAMARDGSSGGCIRTVTIDETGVKRTFTPGDQVGASSSGFAFKGGCMRTVIIDETGIKRTFAPGDQESLP